VLGAPVVPSVPARGWTTEAKITALLGGVCLLLGGAIVGAHREAHQLARLADRVARGERAIATLERIQSALLAADVAERGYVITGRAEDIASYDSAAARGAGLLDDLGRAAESTTIGPDDLALLAKDVRETLGHLALVIHMRRRESFGAAWQLVQSGRGEALLAGATQQIRTLTREEAAAIERETAARGRAADNVTFALLALGALALLLVLASFWILRRDAARERASVQRLAESEQRYRLMFDANPLPMWVYDLETLRFLTVNDAAARQYGYGRDELLNHTIKDIRPPADVPHLVATVAALDDGLKAADRWRHRRKDGSLIDVEITSHGFEFTGRAARLVLALDVTERIRLEEQLRQAQKMEAVGRLAGGVAHDFNNVLSAIFGYVEMVIEDLPADSPSRADLGEVLKAAGRASSLTRQLLAFSRQQVLEPLVLDPNELVREFEKMLRHVIGEDIALRLALVSDAGNVRADPGQLNQVLMNLVVNARDAMPTGGSLIIETANAELTEQYAELHQPVVPGHYVMLAVTDTGCGMTPDVKARVFEPFFTTKERNKGTGLGLSTVYGIVKQSGGYIWVYSEIGRGTTFKIYLPRVDAPAEDITRPCEVGPVAGTETILLAEDDPFLRPLAKERLQKLGYFVLDAEHTDAALALAERHEGTIHLLVADVVMPGASGRELSRRLAQSRPETKVLYVSGYTDDAIVHHGMLEPGLHYLQKPFTPGTLARKVRHVLDGI